MKQRKIGGQCNDDYYSTWKLDKQKEPNLIRPRFFSLLFLIEAHNSVTLTGKKFSGNFEVLFEVLWFVLDEVKSQVMLN